MKKVKKINQKLFNKLIRIIPSVIIILIIIFFVMNKTIKSSCEKAVTNYLENAQNFEQKEIMVVAGNNITVDYIWRLQDWSVFDTSIEEIAQACWKYQTWRNYSEWLSFVAWAWQMIAWFDAGVQWMRLWETKTVTIPYLEAYWARDEKKLLKMEMTDEFKEFKKWDSLMTAYWAIKVYETSNNRITFDTNHELAWKDLIFDITIKQIN